MLRLPDQQGPILTDPRQTAWGRLPASVRRPATLGAEALPLLPLGVLAQIASRYISFLHCHVEKCDEAWKTVS